MSVGFFLILHCNMDTTYKRSLCSIEFFCSLPSELVCIILWEYTQCDFYHIFSAAAIFYLQKILQKPKMIHFWFQASPMEIAGETVRNNGLNFCKKKDLFAYQFRCISLYFLSASVPLSILSVYQSFHDFENFISLFGRFQFLAPTCFVEVIYRRYNPHTTIINWNMRNISTHSWCLFCLVFVQK